MPAVEPQQSYKYREITVVKPPAIEAAGGDKLMQDAERERASRDSIITRSRPLTRP
jgi:hypothetical protein